VIFREPCCQQDSYCSFTHEEKFMKRSITFAGLLLLIACAAIPQASAQKQTIPDYSNLSRAEVPVASTWRIEDLYPGMDAWRSDRERVKVLMDQIDQRARKWTSTPQRFLALYQLTDSIGLIMRRLGAYASNQSNVDLGNATYRSMQGELQGMSASLGAKLAFRNEDILKMNERVLRSYFAKEPRLAEYRFRVEEVLRSRHYLLPKDQQKVFSMTGLFSGATAQVADVLNNVEIPPSDVTLSTGERVTLNVPGYMRYRGVENPADRSLVMRTFWADRKKFENSLAALLDGGIKADLFAARVQGYNSCLHARLFGDDIDTTVYTQLIATVRQNLAPLHRYLALRKKMLGLDTLRYDDIYASAVKDVDRVYPYDEARTMIQGALGPLGEEYQKLLTTAFDNRWIDVYPNKGKQLGAYSEGVYGVHPYIKMNYNGEYDAVSTLAHELGHSLHSCLADEHQTFGNAGYPTFLAEIASTFNEHMLMDYLLKHETSDLVKLKTLDAYLAGVRATIYRQTLFAEFELAMHRHVEEGQTLTPDWLTEQYLALTRVYYGHDKDVMHVNDYIGTEWGLIAHFYMNYYVFQYSTGMIASLALSDRVLHGGQADVDRYLGMLKAGGSDAPLKILKDAGVDMTSPGPTAAALRRFDALVAEMEKLVEKVKKQ
jgi:oligoendopeptidase F